MTRGGSDTPTTDAADNADSATSPQSSSNSHSVINSNTQHEPHNHRQPDVQQTQPIHCELALVFVRFTDVGEGTGVAASAKPVLSGQCRTGVRYSLLAVEMHSTRTTIDWGYENGIGGLMIGLEMRRET